MKNRKKLLAALLAGAMTLSMGATAFAAEAEDGYAVKATNTEATSPDNDLVIAIEGSVSSMDPANIPDTNAISATADAMRCSCILMRIRKCRDSLQRAGKFPTIPLHTPSISARA